MNDNSKIVLVRSNYSPYGGAETFTIELIKSLFDHTDRTIYLLTLPGQNWPIEHKRLTIVPLGISRCHRLVVTWYFNKMVLRYLERCSTDVIFSIDQIERYSYLHAGGGSHLTFLKIKNSSSGWVQRNFRKLSLYHRFILHLERKGLNNPDLKKIICCSKMVANELRQLYALQDNKLHVCYNAIDFESIGIYYKNKEKMANQLRHKFSINPDFHWLLFLGSGFHRKGLDTAIQGLIDMPNKYHLMVVGEGNSGPYKRLADKLGLPERVHFMGPQPQGWRYACMCKALVHPARYEPFGLAVAEAQAMGLPVLVSNKTGYNEIVQQGKSGIVLDLDSDPLNRHQAFSDLTSLIECPRLTPEGIRDTVKHLNKHTIMRELIQECLEIPFKD